MSRLREERGMTLMELLVTMSLLSVVIGATVTFFSSFNRVERVNRLQNEAQDHARTVLGTTARQLRNLASPTEFRPDAVEKAEPHDLVFQTVDPLKPDGSQNDRSIRRMRYCLGQSSEGKAILWRQSQTWTTAAPPPVPSTASCPDSAWPQAQTRELAYDVVNREEGKPIFTYSPAAAPLSDISGLRIEMFVDVNPGKSPAATRLASGVFLRNQNRKPVAAFTATYTGTERRVLLNGSASHDPEGQVLKSYQWYLDGDSTKIANGIIAYWVAPAAGTYRFKLKVTDHAGLEGVASGQEGVVVP